MHGSVGPSKQFAISTHQHEHGWWLVGTEVVGHLNKVLLEHTPKQPDTNSRTARLTMRKPLVEEMMVGVCGKIK